MKSRSGLEAHRILTVSRVLPLRTLSVVAATLPRFLLRSQAIVRLSSCGNICATWSICAAVTLGAATRPPACGLLLGLSHHRTASTVTTMNTRSCGMFKVCSAMVAMLVYGRRSVIEWSGALCSAGGGERVRAPRRCLGRQSATCRTITGAIGSARPFPQYRSTHAFLLHQLQTSSRSSSLPTHCNSPPRLPEASTLLILHHAIIINL